MWLILQEDGELGVEQALGSLELEVEKKGIEFNIGMLGIGEWV